jgi:hypothetical protein
MEIIIRVLLPVLLTLCSREPGYVLPQVGSADTSSGQEEEESQPCNHVFLLLGTVLSEDLTSTYFQALFIQTDKNFKFVLLFKYVLLFKCVLLFKFVLLLLGQTLLYVELEFQGATHSLF